jgi:hypothetical protein
MIRLAIAALLGVLMSGSAMAQGVSPVRDLLSASRNALNDLRFEESVTLSRAVLELPGVRRAERIQALQLLAGALYPEVDDARMPDSAMAVLRSLVRIAPSATIPREVTWPGLDELLREAREWTFGMSVLPPDVELALGLDETAALDVAVSRPARVRLHALPDDGGVPIPLDSAQTGDRGLLRFRLWTDRAPVLHSGSYRLVVTGVDTGLNDSIMIAFEATVESPPLELVAPLVPFDSTQLLPEVTPIRRTRGIISGAVVAIGSMLAGSIAYGGNLSPDAPRDGRALSVGLMMGIGAGAGVWFLDKGKSIPANIAANRDKHRAYADELLLRAAENERRRAAYRARITINTEPNP